MRTPAKRIEPQPSAREVGIAAGGDLVRLITSPDLGPQVVFLGLPIPPLTDREQPPRSGSGHQNSARRPMQDAAGRSNNSGPPQRLGGNVMPSAR
jgi:hypothetical protein